MQTNQETSKRNHSIDILKGVCIILMMWCHLIGKHNQFVYSFHMPVFFIIAGYFFNKQPYLNQFKRYTFENVKRLLYPLYFSMAILCIWGAFQTLMKHDISYVMKYIVSTIWASGDLLETKWGGAYIGPLWFLFALFWCRELFFLLNIFVNKYKKNNFHILIAICAIISYTSTIIHPHIISLPFSLCQGFSCLVFFAIGFYLRHVHIPKIMNIVCIISWPIAICFSNLNLESCHYGFYPLDIIAGIGAYIVLLNICQLVSAYSHSTKLLSIPVIFLEWCGFASLTILCMHTIDMYSGIIYSFACRLSYVHYLIGYGQIVIAMVLSYISYKTRFLNTLYFNHKVFQV